MSTQILDQVREMRAKGMTNTDIAAVLGVSRHAVGKWLSGQRVPGRRRGADQAPRKPLSESRRIAIAEMARQSWANPERRAAAAARMKQQRFEDRLRAGGWTTWRGGECPVDPAAHVEVILRNGKTRSPDDACYFRWCHLDTNDRFWEFDIVAYKVVNEGTVS